MNPIKKSVCIKFYLKKFGKVGKYVVWIVDENYIWTNIDEEFTNFGQHYNFKFIPKNELWINDDLAVEERDFVLLRELY
ncbi:MAG: hypothetical protein ABIG28_01655 [archaeon]